MVNDPIFQPIAIIALMAKSTGIIWTLFSPLQCIERITPFPAAIMSPTGPFKLSTQPGIGSTLLGHTEIK